MRLSHNFMRSASSVILDFVVIAIFVIVMIAMFGCTTLDQKPGPVAQNFNQVPAPVPIACIKPEAVPKYPVLTPVDTTNATHKQIDAANEADLESFRLYAEAARPLIDQCTKGISP